MKTAEQKHSKHVSVPSGEGVRVDKAIMIKRPVEEVYSFWRQLENLPRFMRNVESVTRKDDLHSHWVVKGLPGKTVEWDAELIEEKENEMISWRSTPGSEIENAGSVWFTRVPSGAATQVRVEMSYVPPAGKTGNAIASFFGRDAESEIEGDLRRLKKLLESGESPEESNGHAWTQKTADAFRNGWDATDRCVRNNPWSALGTVALTFFAIGLVIGCNVFGKRSLKSKVMSLVS